MAEPRGISLHIGVNFLDMEHYDGWEGRLYACENDCDAMQAIASAQGFETHVLKSREATRDAVSSAIRNIAKQLQAGDFFLLSYAGHGGMIPDVDGDEEDLVDETWCLYDGELLDDELNILWAEFKAGVRLLVVSDSCHSGTLLKGVDLADVNLREAGRVVEPDDVFEQARAMPRSVAKHTALKNRQFYADLQYSLPSPRPEIQATVRLLAGCQDDELSFESKSGSGRFTEALKQTYADGNFKGDYTAFHQAILEKVKEKQTPNHAVHGTPNEVFDKEPPFKI